MIRINLLTAAEDRTATRKTFRWTRMPVFGGPAILVAVLVVIAWWSWALRAEAANVSRALADAEAVLRTLAPAVDDVRAAEALRSDFRRRLARIEELQTRRNAAAQMLRRLSRGLPDDLWFNEVHQEAGVVVVRGRAAALGTVSDYAAALEATGAFDAPVEIVDSQRGDGQGVVRFEIRMSSPAASAR